MEITTRTMDGIIIVAMSGEIDSRTAPKAQDQVLPLCKPLTRLILDMSLVSYMSSAGLRFMLTLYRQMSSLNGHMVLVGLSEDLQDTMSVTGFLSHFTTADTLDKGVKMLK